MVNSVILKNIKSLQSSIKENVSYIDLNFRGLQTKVVTKTDEFGNTTQLNTVTCEVENTACLRDQLRIWLMSCTNDFHRNPENGGFLEKNVIKRPFVKENCAVIEALLKSEIERKFPNIKIMDAVVTLDTSNRRWLINLSILDKKTGLVDDTMYINGEAIAISTNG